MTDQSVLTTKTPKTIGLIGGMSWESTVTYYQVINEIVQKKCGGLHSAKILLHSLDFDEVVRLQTNNLWAESAKLLGDAARNLQNSGADFVLICTNTMHKVASKVAQDISVPLLHIAEATADELKAANIRKVGLLGTKYTMTEDFYKAKLREAGLEVLIPEKQDLAFINHVIFDELCCGILSRTSKACFLEIMSKLHTRGAEGIILGCTEIGLLIKQEDVRFPIFDTALIHARKAALRALE